ncbi:MAG: hypothetical protein HY644_08800 [Acidobacteria bacterium]|nr:hypothetical protein [Acidobacteriota bacterium]
MTRDRHTAILSPSDLFLAPELAEQRIHEYLRSLGFRDPAAADRNLQLMAEAYAVRQALGAMADSVMEAFSRSPDPDAALVAFERYLAGRTAKVNFLDYLREDPPALDLLTQLLGTSPFLSEILIRNPEYLHSVRHDYNRATGEMPQYQEEMGYLLENLRGTEAILNALKRFKRREILRIASRDILGKDTLQFSTAQLSHLADVLVGQSLQLVTEEYAEQAGHVPGTFAVIGLGKLGGQELNYSSDIDLIYVYDSDTSSSATEEFFQKLSRNLTRALTEYTAESYLYRVDLRLRPMGKTGAIAYSLQQYRHYYESWGETFERFAMIKARPIAGDIRLGERFLEIVQPFVYRKYLDQAALEEIARMKARADAGSRRRREPEQNVKTGRGGIREIELFTQVMQLLYGGHQPELREPNTLKGLEKLAHAKLISESACHDLTRAYIFLRTVEHRLQIVQERQLHLLPTDKVQLEICARRLGFPTAASLEVTLSAHRDRVHEIYQGLLHEKKSRKSSPAREFFRILCGEPADQEILETLAGYGFRDSQAILSAIQSWDQAPSLAHSPTVTRNLLANLLPVLLEQVASCAAPTRVLNRIEQLATRTGAASSFLRTLLEDTVLRDRLIAVVDSGELLAQRLLRYPELLDSLVVDNGNPATLWEGLFTSSVDDDGIHRREHISAKRRPATSAAEAQDLASGRSADLEQFCNSALNQMAPLERADRMNALRRFKAAQEFKIIMNWLLGDSLQEIQARLSLLAQCCVCHVASWHDPCAHRRPPEKVAEVDRAAHRPGVTRRASDIETRRRPHAEAQGYRPGKLAALRVPVSASPQSGSHRKADQSDWVIFALGKLGGGELTVHSDLDLVFIYRGDPSDSEAFTRHQAFVQEVQNFLGQPTPHGVAYKIDTRLRPEGTKGPLAMPVMTFQNYLRTRAEKWERLAWTRARFIAGSETVAAEISQMVAAFVYGPWDTALVDYMDRLRARMEKELSKEGEGGKLDFKVGSGALADIDFLLEMIQIREGWERAEFRIGGTNHLLSVLEQATTRRLTKKEIVALRQAYSFLCRLEILARMESDSNVTWIANDPDVVSSLGKRMALPAPEGQNLLRRYRQTTQQVRNIYKRALARLRG